MKRAYCVVVFMSILSLGFSQTTRFDFLKGKMSTKNIPFLDIKIDQGEKNRQKIDELLRAK